MNLKLNFDFKKILLVLQKAQPYVFGLALIGVFGYTAFLVNEALNVKPSETAPATTSGKASPASAKITFDKTTIESIKKLNVVQGDVPVGSLGKDDPFK